jgi:hypothetical protein
MAGRHARVSIRHQLAVRGWHCDNVQAAIERTIRPMNFIIRPIARHRLLWTNRPPAHVTILMRDDSLVVTFEGHPSSDGHRNDDFVFFDGGERMVLHVLLEAEHLPGPLDYTLEFRRLH